MKINEQRQVAHMYIQGSVYLRVEYYPIVQHIISLLVLNMQTPAYHEKLFGFDTLQNHHSPRFQSHAKTHVILCNVL